MLHMEMAGQKIIYKDLTHLRVKLAELLQKTRQDREAHDRESRRLRPLEKSIQKMLGENAGREDRIPPIEAPHDD